MGSDSRRDSRSSKGRRGGAHSCSQGDPETRRPAGSRPRTRSDTAPWWEGQGRRENSLQKRAGGHKNPQKMLLLTEVLRLMWPETFTCEALQLEGTEQ